MPGALLLVSRQLPLAHGRASPQAAYWYAQAATAPVSPGPASSCGLTLTKRANNSNRWNNRMLVPARLCAFRGLRLWLRGYDHRHQEPQALLKRLAE